MKKRFNQFMENLVMLVIFLVLVQTFLTDWVVVTDGSWAFREKMIWSAFFFDLFFTMEFLIRFFSALYRGKGELGKYFFYRQGWVDFIVSIPLLLLSSTPDLFALVTGTVIGGFGGVLNILKIVKSIRIARMLRLLRVLKIFKHIKYADSVMAQRHTSRIVTTVVTSIIMALTIMSFTGSFFYMNDLNTRFEEDQKENMLYLLSQPELLADEEALADYCDKQTDFLIIKKSGDDLFSRYEQDYYSDFYGYNDYAYISSGEYGFYYDLKPVNVTDAWASLIVFAEIILVILVIMLTYSTHFAINVSDPVNIMYKGLNEEDYNLEVAIPKHYGNDDIFRLAQSYNDEFLPLKARAKSGEEKSEPMLELGDLDDLFNI
jgi:hypothetical protein